MTLRLLKKTRAALIWVRFRCLCGGRLAISPSDEKLVCENGCAVGDMVVGT